jgi:hypothetical protein
MKEQQKWHHKLSVNIPRTIYFLNRKREEWSLQEVSLILSTNAMMPKRSTTGGQLKYFIYCKHGLQTNML